MSTGNLMSPQDIVERALAASTAGDCQVIVSSSSTANIRWAGNTLTTNGVAAGRDVTVIATIDGGQGAAVGVLSRSNPDLDSLAELVRAAEESARRNGPAEDANPLITPDQAPASTGWDDAAAQTSIAVFGDFAAGLGEAFGLARAARRGLYGFAEHSVSTTHFGTSAGLRLRHVQPTGKVEVNAKSLDPTRAGGPGASAWAGVATRDFTDVDITAIDTELTRRLDWGRREIALPAGRYETLLPPTALADLLINAYWSAAGREAAEGRTVFSSPGGTRLGEKLSPLPIRMYSDPHAPGLECEPFALASSSSSMSSVFDNGLALARTDWIRDGALNTLVHTRATAAKAGSNVAHPIDNLIVDVPEPGRDLAAMIAGTERALLVTCLWYIREVDAQTLLLTGLTRDGVYLVENGEVVGAVNNFRFNESPIDMLGRLLEVGPSAPTLPREWSDYFTRAAMPPVRVADFGMSSVSQAS